MAPLPRGEFLASLRRLDGDRLAAFVAAVWRARGFEVSRDGRTLRVSAGAEPSLVRVRPRTRWLGRTTGPIPDGTDVVVTNVTGTPGGTPPGARVVDADELYDLVLYGIDREDADGICREFLGRPATVPREPGGGNDGTLAVVPRDPRLVAGGALAVIVTAAGLVGALGGVPGATESSERGFQSPASDAPVTEVRPEPVAPAGNATGDGADPRENVRSPGIGTDAATGASGGSAGGFPPGLGPEGVTDAELLAGAHAEALAGRSYQLTITYREFVGGRPVGLARERVWVADATTHVSAVERFGRTRYDRSYVGGSAYANGSTRTLMLPRGRRAVPVRPGVYAERVERYLGWFLSVDRSRVVERVERDGRTLWFVRLDDDPYWGVQNATGTAVVDDRGIVRSVRRSYDATDSNVSAAISIHYPRIGGVTVEPPDWYRSDGAGGDPGSSPHDRSADPLDDPGGANAGAVPPAAATRPRPSR